MEKTIGSPIDKVDNKEKIGGYAKYIADIKFDNMLYAKTLRSERPRADILSIDIPSLPDGYYIVDKNDIPGKNRIKIILDDQPFFADKRVNYVGEPILLVVGADKSKILEIISNIKVNYQDIDPILTIEDAEDKGKEPIYGNDNLFADYMYTKGDPYEEFKSATDIVEETYNTGYQEHVYIEPQGITGVYENGKINVYGSLQCPYYVKNALMQGLNFEKDRIRVVQTTTGGAFGGKEDYPSITAGHVAFASIKTGKPVQLIFDRVEDIVCTTKRHPSCIRIKTAFDKNKKITAMELEVKLNGGAYAGLSMVVLQRAIFAITGVYNIQNLIVKGKVYSLNCVPSGAYRGFGCPQATFAIEMHMNQLAKKMGQNPMEFKSSYFVKQGDATCTSGTFRDPVKLPEMTENIEEMCDFSKKHEIYSREDKSKKIRGIGLSIFLHGCGFTGSGEQDHIKAEVKVRKNSDSTVSILVANVDMGQGLKTVFRKIASNVLNMPIENILYDNPDTDEVPDSGPTAASRSVMVVGRLVELAARELRDRWDEASTFEIMKKYKQPGFVNWDQVKLCGDAYPTYSWGANVVEVEIDPITYEITLTGTWAVFDVGTVIDERIMRGQIEGGILQGLGHASIEVMESKNGRIMQRSITDYIIPTAKDVTNMGIRLIDNPYEDGPFGAKGAGELTLVGAPAALAAAVENALGINLTRVPVTPEYLLEVMENADKN